MTILKFFIQVKDVKRLSSKRNYFSYFVTLVDDADNNRKRVREKCNKGTQLYLSCSLRSFIHSFIHMGIKMTRSLEVMKVGVGPLTEKDESGDFSNLLFGSFAFVLVRFHFPLTLMNQEKRILSFIG